MGQTGWACRLRSNERGWPTRVAGVCFNPGRELANDQQTIAGFLSLTSPKHTVGWPRSTDFVKRFNPRSAVTGGRG